MVVVEARVMDATHLELTRPTDTPTGGKVVVSVIDPAREVNDRDAWLSLSLGTLASAYGDSEPEYTQGMIKEPNPEYGKGEPCKKTGRSPGAPSWPEQAAP
jgi:hypothetical protein